MAPQPQVAQAIETPGNAMVRGADGKLRLARWTVGIFAEHDKNGWGPSSRVDYRVNNRFGIVGMEVKKTVSAGVTVRLGAVK